MEANERAVIDELFAKLRQVGDQGQPRDAEAEAFIAGRLAAQPGAAYYMAQTIVVQERALENAQAQLAAAPARESGGGFLSGLFGGGQREAPAAAAPANAPRRGPWDNAPGQRGGGGFLAGAAQTAVGVAGGVLVGNMLMNAFSGDPAAAATPEPAAEPASDNDTADSGAGDDGGDFGGSDDFGDF